MRVKDTLLPTKETEQLAVEYVSLVFDGYDKVEAFKEVFPDRYNAAVEKAIKNKRNQKATIISVINSYERGKYIQSLYSMASEQYYSRFIHKTTTALEELHNIGMDEEQKMSHRLVALKTFLGARPTPKEEIIHKVEHDVADEFEKKLLMTQKKLYDMANPEVIEEAIILDNGIKDEE